MAPTYRAGDLLLIDPNMETPIRVGEIVTYTAGKKTITHRVVAIEGNMLVTQGDSNPQPDAWNTPITHVEGRPFLSLPWLGYVFYILKTPLGWVALVLIPTVIILADEMMKIYAALRQAATR
jgi:signal peptidase